MTRGVAWFSNCLPCSLGAFWVQSSTLSRPGARASTAGKPRGGRSPRPCRCCSRTHGSGVLVGRRQAPAMSAVPWWPAVSPALLMAGAAHRLPAHRLPAHTFACHGGTGPCCPTHAPLACLDRRVGQPLAASRGGQKLQIDVQALAAVAQAQGFTSLDGDASAEVGAPAASARWGHQRTSQPAVACLQRHPMPVLSRRALHVPLQGTSSGSEPSGRALPAAQGPRAGPSQAPNNAPTRMHAQHEAHVQPQYQPGGQAANAR
jgi:hypothetical protein